MDTHTLSFKIRTDLDDAQLHALLVALAEKLVDEVESHGGEVEDYKQPKDTAAVEPE
tara:strand:- start:196 stop:366 length:171 start_codon:yes stop_codon:yes gene_type:complete